MSARRSETNGKEAVKNISDAAEKQRLARVHIPGTPHEDHYESQEITLERLQELMPKVGKRKRPRKATQEMLDMVKDMENSTGILQEYLEEQVLSNYTMLGELKLPFKSYVDAIKFVALRSNMDVTEAWGIVFPQKMKRLKDKIAAGEQINVHAHATAFNKSKIVTMLTKQTLLHASIAYAPSHARAMEKLSQLMEGRASAGAKVSAKVQLDAAIALEAATRMPEDKTLKVSINQSDAQLEQQKTMNDNLAQLVASMQQGFREGKSAADLQKIHTVEVIEAETEDA